MPVATPHETRIGWVGTGVMGVHMAMYVLKQGYSLSVFNRTASKAQSLVDAGAKLCTSLKQLAENSDVVFTIVGYPHDVRSVILTAETGLLDNLREGGVIIDMTTSSPALAREISARAIAQGKHSMDGPVSGGDTGARNGALSVMLGADDKKVVEFVRPIVDCFSKTVTYMGKAGAGQHCKMGNQITIATNIIGVCEGLLYAQSAGLDVETYLSAVQGGAAGSFSLSNLAPRIVSGNLDPGFFVQHFVKDLGIALESCKDMNLSMPGLSLANQLYMSMMGHGEGNLGIHGLIRVLERLSNRTLKTSEME